MENLGTWDYSGTVVDFDRIPSHALVTLAKKGIQHKLGNEVAAALVREREKAEKDGRTLDSDEEDEFTNKARAEMVQKFYDGTIGLRVTGPRGTTLENIAFELAFEEARKVLEPKGLWPKADRKANIKAEDATVIFAGEPHTREMLADLMLEKYKEKFTEAAKIERQARIDKAKANKANAVPVKKEGVEQSASDLF